MIYAYFLLETLKISYVETWNEILNLKKKPFLIKKLPLDHFEKWKNSINKKIFNFDYEKSIFFDSGTYNGYLELRISDMNGNSLLYKVLNPEQINFRGNLFLDKGFTNNFGEAFSCLLAMKYAIMFGFKSVTGDSSLVIFYLLSEFQVLKTKFDSHLFKLLTNVYLEFKNLLIRYL